MMEGLVESGLNLNQWFENSFGSSNPKLNILGWKPAINHGWEIAVLYVQEELYYERDGAKYRPIAEGCIKVQLVEK